MKAARLDADKVIEEYKKSEDFKMEVAEGCIDFYHLGFLDCKKVDDAFSRIDLKDIIESNKENEEEENNRVGGAKGLVKVKADQVGVEVASNTIIKKAIEGIIAEAIIRASIMAAKATEDQHAVQEDAQEE